MMQTRHKFGGEKPIDIQGAGMQKRGFLPAQVLAKSQRFALRQSRGRVIGMYLRATKTKHFAPDIPKTFLSFECAPLPLECFLADSNNCRVRRKAKESDKNGWVEGLKAVQEELGKGVLDHHQKKLSALTCDLDLTPRETWVVTTAVVRLINSGYDPYCQKFIFNVDINLAVNRCVFRSTPLKIAELICGCLLVRGLAFDRMANKDQSFNYGVFCKKNPELAPCVTPGAKFIVSQLWCELNGKA